MTKQTNDESLQRSHNELNPGKKSILAGTMNFLPQGLKSKNVDFSFLGIIVQPPKHTFEIVISFSRFSSLCDRVIVVLGTV